MLGGTTRMTVSLAVTIFEVTGSLVFIIPIMISVVCSKLVSDAFGKYGIYDLLVALKGYPYVPRVAEANPNLTAESIMSSNPVCISVADHTVKSLSNFIFSF